MKLFHSITLLAALVITTLLQLPSHFFAWLRGEQKHYGLRYGVKVGAVSTQGFMLEVSTDSGVTWVEVKNITDIPDPTGTASDLDATNLASTSKEYIAGLRDSQSATINGQRVALDPGQKILRLNAGNATPLQFRNTFSDGEILTYLATVKKFAVTGSTDSVQMFSTEIRGSGTGTWSGAGTP